jgi:hypothetical protein
MLPAMARFALSWGGGTHFDDPDFIGKFGFGLPNASINQTRRVDVYTRTHANEPFVRASLDANEVSEHGLQSIGAPVEAELPPFVQRYLVENGLALDHGAVVVWDKPDRLTYRMASSLKEHLVDDFGAVYRYLLRDEETGREIELNVEKVKVEPVDPLFLDKRARYYLPHEQGGAQLILDRSIPVKYYRDPDTGAMHAAKIQDKEEIKQDDPNLVAVGPIHVKVARFPVGFAEYKGKRKVETTDAHRRFEIRKSRRGMSFVRAGREIETIDVFPRSMRDVASGLGHWPLLQGYAYHWGIEVKFDPSLDEIFGITNDKQTVRPIEDFWRILAEEEIDTLLHRENQWQADQREKKKPKAEPSVTPSPAETAASAADMALGKKTRVPEALKDDAKAKLEAEAHARVGVTEKSMEEAVAAIEKEGKHRPYRIGYFDDPNGPFYEPVWVGAQFVVRINRQHPFYDSLYGEILALPGGTRAKEAVDVLLIALGRAELQVDDGDAKIWYETQRIEVWSRFLARALKALAQSLRPDDEHNGEGADEEGTGAKETAAGLT